MRKAFFIPLLAFFIYSLFGCKKDSSNNRTSSSTYSWSCKIDGKSYSWSGTYPSNSATNTGLSTFTRSVDFSSLALSAGGSSTTSYSPCDIILSLPVVNGPLNYTITQNTSSLGHNATITLQSSLTNVSLFTTSINGGSMSVSITSFSPNSFVTSGAAGAGKVIGTFQGQLKGTVNGTIKTINITEGKFEAVRLQ